MIQTKDLSFLARAARTLTGATTMARAAVLLLAVMMMTTLGVQTARAQTYARSIMTVMYEHGTVTTDKTSAYEGETVTLTVTPDAGYHLALLYLDDGQSISYSGSTAIFPVQSSTDPSKYTFTCPATTELSAALIVTATFEEDASLTIRVVPEGCGTYDLVDGTKLYVTPETDYYINNVSWYSGNPDGGGTVTSVVLNDAMGYYEAPNSSGYVVVTLHKWGDYDDVRVSFNMKDHGTAPAAQNLTLGDKVKRPDDPTADGYTFLGWYTNSSCTKLFDFDTVLDNTLKYDKSNDRYTLTLYAKWAVGGSCGKSGSDVKWYVSKSAGSTKYDVLTIFGSGEMEVDKKNERPWYDYRYQIKTVVVEEGVTHISQYAFHDFVNVTSDITIPASVTSIGEYAFQLVSESTAAGIHISASEGSALTSIGKAFYEANASIDLSRCASLTAISTDLLFCAVTKDVTLPSSVTSICQWAFNRFSDEAFTGDHAYVVVPEGKALSVTIDGVTEPVVLVPTDGKSDILACLYADPSNRGASRALTLAMVDMLGDNNYTMTGWDGTTRDVALCRTFPAGKKQTVCLPFAPTAIYDLGTVWEFTGIESGKVVMTERTLSTDGALKANTPYIFEANASNPDVTGILFPNVAISIGSDPKTAPVGEDFVFQGTYERKHWEASEALAEGIYGFLSMDSDEGEVGQFVKCDRNTNIKPFRAYLKYEGELSGTQTATARRKSAAALPDVIDIVWVSASGATTGITTTNFTNYTNAAGAWYSLDGRRLSGKPTKRGMYLNNGKKIIIK